MIYDTFTLGSSTNYIAFNDDTNPDYYIRAQKRYPTRREIREFDSVVPDEMGVVDYQTLVGKSYIVVEAKLYPGATDSGLYAGEEKIKQVCNPAITQADTDSDSGYVLLKWTENETKQLRVKPIYVDIPETIKGSHTPKIRILLKVRYPFAESQESHTVSMKPTVTSGAGLEIPSTGIEIPTGGIGIGADSGSGNGLCTNVGDYNAYPVFNITAPINNMRITNSTTGKYIEFTYNLSSGTANITIDYDGVTAETSSGVNLLQYLSSGSSLDEFYLRPGDNQLTLTATSIGAAADVVVTYRDSWPI